jgi:hypothetical protein
MILKCNGNGIKKCDSEYQDYRYGKEQRVHNQIETTGTQPKKYRCTVCGNVREVEK